MRRIFILIIICLLSTPGHTEALLLKKNYKQISTENAIKAAKNNDYVSAIAIVEDLISKYPKDLDLVKIALEYSIASENWDKAIIYNDKLLNFEPKSECLLNQGGFLYSKKLDFACASKYYEKLVEYHPKLAYKKELANMYMENREFEKALCFLESLYNSCPEDNEVVQAYLKSLLALKRTKDAYWLIQKHKLGNTKEAFLVLGDLAMDDECYDAAGNYYRTALRFDPKDLNYKNKLAYSYRMADCDKCAAALYREVLNEDANNLDARLGLGYLEIDKKNFKCARQIFESILSANPCYRPAQIAIADSYIENDERFAALEVLGQLIPDEESTVKKAQIYYDMNMLTDSKDVLGQSYSTDAKDLKYKIRRDDAITITELYSFFFQKLSEQYKLDYHKFNTHVSQNVKRNAQIFMDYNVIVYSSGRLNQDNNVVNEFRTGVMGHPTEKWAYRADIGVKSFEFGGGMINTDSWIQHFFSDKFNLKVGYLRDNIEQSYLSAVGEYLDGVFTGRAANNKFYVDYNAILPNQFYTFGRAAYGVITAQNLITNQYYEGMIGIGRHVYDNSRNKWINTVDMDITSYNSGYQFDLLKIYDSTGQLFGNYFSPTYFNANTLNIKAEGNVKPWRLKYGLKVFGGIQTAVTPDQTTPAWGVSPYITYDINDNVSIYALFNHFTYADLNRDQFIISAVIRGFNNHAKK